ncbi:MAG: PAS domain-containing protein, partial [Undibacterium sp.]|nr:PAS domain-containing protein [Undibacterium sp.]
MSLQSRIIAYLLMLHIFFFSIGLYFFRKEVVLVIGLEVVLLVSLAFGIYLVKKVFRSFEFTLQFRELLRDGNYSTRLKLQPQARVNREFNDLLDLFNRMLEALYQERLQLGEQRGFLDRLLEATPSAVMVFDFEGRISLLNVGAKKLLGLNEVQVQGKNLSTLRQEIEQGKEHRHEQGPTFSRDLLVALDGLAVGESKLVSDQDARRYRCQRGQFIDRGFSRDFLLIDEMTAELASSEKATYEKLVRVLAHEVNNTVGATGSVLESLLFYREQLRTDDREDYCTAILAVQKRNANLAEFIERFTRVVKMPAAEMKPCSVRELIDGILYLYRQRCSEQGIALDWVCCEAIPMQNMDSHLMEQSFLNIIK